MPWGRSREVRCLFVRDAYFFTSASLAGLIDNDASHNGVALDDTPTKERDMALMPTQSAMNDIVALDALALSDAIRERRVSCREVMQAYLAHIAQYNPAVNAIVSLRDAERCSRKPTRVTDNSRTANTSAGCTVCRMR